MKKIYIGILFIISALTACTYGASNRTTEADSINQELREKRIQDSIMEEEEKERRMYINSVKGHKEEYSITGRFVDDNIDTLWFHPSDKGKDVWELCCSNKKVRRCEITGLLPKLVFEGDLDGNGTDDFGFLDTWYTSNCRNYYVVTIRNHTFMSMLEIETAFSLRASGKDLVEKSSQEGYAHVFCSDMEAPLSSCSCAPTIDTLIKFNYHRLK